jgi:hypothetical protein
MCLPASVWQRWSDPSYDLLRQAVLIFNGDTHKEAALEQFRDVSLLYQEGEGTNSVTGVFCLTTKRFVFLPHFQLPHPKLVQSRFISLKSLSGTRSDLTVTLTDQSDGTVNFQFKSTTSLFIAFNLLRLLCETSRKTEATFCKVISQISTQSSPDDSPFSSIDVELPPCESSFDVPESTVSVIPTILPPVSESGSTISRMTAFFDYCNRLRFDIHIKLRLLFIASAVSVVLHFIPFLPLLVLAATFYSLWQAWTIIETGPVKPTNAMADFTAVKNFFDDWLGWRNYDKTKLILRWSAFVWFLWMILPGRFFYGGFLLGYVALIILPLYRRGIFWNLVSGFWFCT